jgi:hypothetical protein
MILTTYLTKDQLMDLAEHVNLILVERTDVDEVVLHVDSQLSDVIERGEGC